MNALTRKSMILVVLIVIALLASGCQSAKTVAEPETKSEATSLPEPTTEQEPKIIVDSVRTCTVEDYESREGIEIQDAELGTMTVGVLSTWILNCDEPYLKGKGFAIQDFYDEPSTGNAHWISRWSLITDEGGLWRCGGDESTYASIMECEGYGKYQGLEMSLNASLSTNKAHFIVTEKPEE